MTYVEVYQLNNDGSQKVIATCRLVDNKVEITGESSFVEELQKNGIYDYSNRVEHLKLFPKDGVNFLEQLKFNFKSGYFNASEVKKA